MGRMKRRAFYLQIIDNVWCGRDVQNVDRGTEDNDKKEATKTETQDKYPQRHKVYWKSGGRLNIKMS